MRSLLIALFVFFASATAWAESTTLTCQTVAGTADATCPEYKAPDWSRGVCIYAYDDASGGSTFTIQIQVKDDKYGFDTWYTGGNKTAVNEAGTCFYPSTFTGPAIFGAAAADVIVGPTSNVFRIFIDKTAAVNTRFEVTVYPLR